MNSHSFSVENKIKKTREVLKGECLIDGIICNQISHQGIWMWSAHLRQNKELEEMASMD